jgi:hypothetical protein
MRRHGVAALAWIGLAGALLGGLPPVRGAASDGPRTLRVALTDAPPAPGPRGWTEVVDAAIGEWRRQGLDLRAVEAGAAPELAADIAVAREIFGHDLDAELLSLTVRSCRAAGCRVSAVLNEVGLSAAPAAAAAAPSTLSSSPTPAAPGTAGRAAVAPIRDTDPGPAPRERAGAAPVPVAPAPRAQATTPAGHALWTATTLPAIVAHEIGHLLGLEHDDTSPAAAKSLMALMVAVSSGRERSSARSGIGAIGTAGVTVEPDATGAEAAPVANSAIGAAGVTPTVARSAAAVAAAAALFPPRNETFDFRARLEQKYSDSLGRQPAPTFVDVEGSVVWVQEYLRYRLEGCPHGDASTRVLRQILGEGVQPSCGSGGWSGAPPFPPRDETFAFRQQLEDIYRRTLGRDAVLSAVDPEGDVVWTQEYLRYRLGGCSHGTAVDAVLAQVAGRPAPPVCATSDSPAPGQPPSGDLVENPRRLAFFSPDHARFSAYQVGLFPHGAAAPVQVVVVPLAFVQQEGAEQVIDLAAAGLVPPAGQVFTFRARGVWPGGVTAWSDASQPFIRR